MAIDYQRFINLKQRVKNECLRRNQTGSVESYGGSSYDYTNVPTKRSQIMTEHYSKNAIPLNAINNITISDVDGNRVLVELEMEAMEDFVSNLTSREMGDSTGTDCRTSCTGLCYGCTGTCSGECTSCTGTAEGGCLNCASDCSGGCSGCSGSCSGGCSGSCKGSCSGGCTGGCQSSCSSCNACGGTCSGGCKSGCSGCRGTCTIAGASTV